MTTDKQVWPLAIRLFHWLTLVLVVLAWWSMETLHDYPKGSPDRDVWMSWHITIGLLVLFVTIVRLVWRSGSIAPELPVAAWQKKLSRRVQAGIYVVLLLMPVTGMLARQVSGKGMLIANQWQLLLPVGDNAKLAHWIAEFHEDILWPALLILVGVHAAAALLHQFYWRDKTLRSMLG